MTLNFTQTKFIAHVRDTNRNEQQSLENHLRGVGALSHQFADKFGLPMQGLLMGLLHDLGKYSTDFQHYLLSATGLLNQDEDEDYVDAKVLKGKIDHSTSGAQFVWSALSTQSAQGQFAGQVLALCIASHHSGLIDCLSLSEKVPVFDSFSRRMSKADQATHLAEVCRNADPGLMQEVQRLLSDSDLTNTLWSWGMRLAEKAPRQSAALHQQLGLLVRALFSCLIDADRIDTADFEHPRQAMYRPKGAYREWDVLIQRLESHLADLPADKPVDESKPDINRLRRKVSAHCLEAAPRSTGIYTLSVPTGGGKTLASLR
ncbi:MAG: CRISPR-associated endonuclease Cas3'', partial [Rhodoferax sp.]|nr:CRISPR-associated endonuclease Cas3'' [Rhodoferax sp.]